jgi:hypothetical protein
MVEEGSYEIDGIDYEIYYVYENDELIFGVEPYSSEMIGEIRVFGPTYRTEKGVGAGSTFAEVKAKYSIKTVEEGGLHIFVEEIPASFYLETFGDVWDEWPDDETIPDGAPISYIALTDPSVCVQLHNNLITKNSLTGSPWLGLWIRNDNKLTVTNATGNSFAFILHAYGGGGNTGEIEGVATVNGNGAVFRGEYDCVLEFELQANSIISIKASAECSYYAGMGVYFLGEYKKQ